MKVLVTGASGYIGSHLCKILSERGHSVEGWDIELYGDHNDVTYYCDKYRIQDVTKSLKYFRDQTYDAVVHLAGRSVVPESMTCPTEYYRVNITGTDNVVKNINTPHLLFASTASAWEMASPYAISKRAAEDVIKEHADGYTIFRFFNVSGTDGVNKQLGEATHLIRVAAMAATGKIPEIKIYGNDYDTRDGTCLRDYVHVVDLANAIANAIERGPANTPYECLGSNTGYSVLEVLDAFERATGVTLKRAFAPRRDGDAVVSLVDNISDLINAEKTVEDMCLDQYNLEKSKEE